MISGVQIRGMRERLKKLEAAAGKGRRCVACRLTLRHSWPDPKKPKPRPDDLLKVKCEFCRTEYTVALTRFSGVEREANRLFYSYTLEDIYTDPRAHALSQWFLRRPKPAGKAKRRAPARAKVDAKVRALADLREVANKLYARKHKMLQSKYGESPFPDQLELIKAVEDRQREKRSKAPYAKGLFELELAETAHMICAELEKIIWGRTSPETAAAIDKLGSEIEELIVTTIEKEEREKEERRLKNLASLNNNRARCGLPPLPEEYGKS